MQGSSETIEDWQNLNIHVIGDIEEGKQIDGTKCTFKILIHGNFPEIR